MNALMACLGDASGTGLAQSVRAEAFAKNGSANGQTLTPDYATIGAARLVFVSEPQADIRINWAEIKKLTGGGKMNVNPKNEKAYAIDAQFSMFWDTNYSLRVDDQTVFDRGTIRILPCEHVFAENQRDKKIDQKLAKPAARSYLLRQALEGLEDYEKNGFAVPEECREALAEYEKSSDKIGEFLTACFVKTGRPADKIMIAKTVYPAYVKWLEENGYKGVESRPEFVRKLKNRPGVTIGTRQNAQTLDGWAEADRAALLRVSSGGAPAVKFGGGDPLSWYLQNYTAEGPAEREQQAEQLEVGSPENEQQAKTPAPALTLGALVEDFRRRTKAEDPAAELPDDFGIFADLLRRGWKLTPAAEIFKSEIHSHHILTAAELAQRGQQRAQAIREDLRKQVAAAIDGIEDERTRKATRYLAYEGTLGQYSKKWTDSVRRLIMAAIIDGDPLDNEIIKEAQRIQSLEAGPKKK